MPESRYLIGDVFDLMAKMADASVDLIVTSPPFLALRSYLPEDSPDKEYEIGCENSPNAFLHTLLRFSEECRRVLTPLGSLCVELGDTYSGSGGPGGDYNAGGMRAGQPRTTGSSSRARNRYVYGDKDNRHAEDEGVVTQIRNKGGAGWPLPKSLCMVPQLYAASLAYGRNLLAADQDDHFDPWRVRNWITWARTNPPVGRLADKFRPACSYITVACTDKNRYFDLDAVRKPSEFATPPKVESGRLRARYNDKGAPPLDWHDDSDAGVGLLILATQPYKGSHYATWPLKLPLRLIEAMCPVGGWVLDPFAGSGTTLAAAHLLGRNSIGLDLDPRNHALTIQRMAGLDG